MSVFSKLALLWALLVSALGCGTGKGPARPQTAVEVAWTFEPPERGAIISSPVVADGSVFIYAIRDAGFSPRGAVYSLTLATGEKRAVFDDDGEMRHGYSTPAVAGDSLIVGEGMHANHFCKLYCLDRATLGKRWQYTAKGHIESTPAAAGGRVIFGAGDDGVICLDAVTGNEYWHFHDAVHIDSRPEIAGEIVLIGAGVSRAHARSELIGLRRANGTPAWRTPVDLPAWGSPVAFADVAYFGLGNGRLDASAAEDKRRGALVAVNVADGKQLWRHDLPDAVMNQVAITNEAIYLTCRDGRLYALRRSDGKRIWQQNLGSAAVTRPAISGERIYTVASAGQVACFDAATGNPVWSFDVAAHSGAKPFLVSSPAVVENRAGRLILFGAELKTPANSAAVLFCLRER